MAVPKTQSPALAAPSTGWVHEAPWFKGPFAKRSNRTLLLRMAPMVEAFERRIVDTVDPSVAEWVREDLIAAAPWHARRTTVHAAVQRVYEGVAFGLGTFGVIVAAALLATDGPLWLRLLLVGAAAVVAGILDLQSSIYAMSRQQADWERLSEAVRTTPEGIDLAPGNWAQRFVDAVRPVTVAALLAVPGSLIALVWLWPAAPFDSIEAAAALVVTAVASALAIGIWGRIISRSSAIRSATIVLTVVLLAGYGQGWLLARADRADWWYGPEFGALLGTAFGALLGAIQLGLRLFETHQSIRKFHRNAEQEFVHAALSALTNADPDWPNRALVVGDVEYLAGVLDRSIAGVLRREDPASAADIATSLGARAAALRARKRDVLLGQPGAMDALQTTLGQTVVIGARREWSALAADPGWESAERPRLLARATRLVVRVLIFVLPFAIGAVVAIVGDVPVASWLPAAVPFALGWVAVNLAELIAPGLGRGVADTATGTEILAKRLRNR